MLTNLYHLFQNQLVLALFIITGMGYLIGNLRIRKGEILKVSGPAELIDLMGLDLGAVDLDVTETDMLTFAFGIPAGVVLGLFKVKIGGVSVGLGSAGGLLIFMAKVGLHACGLA